MAKETVDAEEFSAEVSQNERTNDDRVYFYFEHNVYDSAIVECYLSVADFKRVLKMFTRLDEQLVMPE